MTALAKYDRLEATGLWRDQPGGRLREVIVGLRNTTLLLCDPKTEQPLTQWSLPAIRRLVPGKTPAVYSPSPEGEEELELTDEAMIEALDMLRRSFERQQARPGRLRLGLIAAAAAAVVLGLGLWLPGKLVDFTAATLPGPAKAGIGDLALADLARLTGSACRNPQAEAAADRLALRLFPKSPPRIVVLRDGLKATIALPGPIFAIPLADLERAIGPDPIAGSILRAELASRASDPLRLYLDHAGSLAVLGLLTSGRASAASADGFAEAILSQAEAAPIDAAALLSAFERQRLSAIPYAESLGPDEAELQRTLTTGDPFPTGSAEPVLGDEDWLMLQAACG